MMREISERVNEVAFHLYKTFGNYPMDTAEQFWEDMPDHEMSWWQETAREIINLSNTKADKGKSVKL